MLVALFGLFREGERLSRYVIETADRLLGYPGERLVAKMVATVRGIVNGMVMVAVTIGTVFGLAYSVAGVPDAFLFTFLTVIFAMVPFGVWVALTTAALILFLQSGNGWTAASLFGFGAVVLLLSDNFIWPALVGGGARLPFLLALIGIFGGLQTFGLIGLIIGPAVMATLLTVWRDWSSSPT